jgi:uncharacterized protein (TIGR03086 family)
VTTGLTEAVELLERALSYTRGTLATVDDASLRRATPCGAWTLDQLLDHMADALDAFTEAASGYVAVRPRGPAEPGGTRVEALQSRACALLGAWATAAPGPVVVGDRALGPALLVATAALEITVHGWDVGQATGQRTPVPARLARALLPVARRSVTEADREDRFAAPRPATGTSYDARLLAFLGRDLTGPPVANTTKPDTRRRDTP